MRSKIKNQISKIILSLLVVFCLLLIASSQMAHADAVTDNALNYLREKQDGTGRITTGFSAPSQWSAIAFTINGVDVAQVKKIDKSLYDYLLKDIPASGSAATEWESRLLAIVAIGGNPTNFGDTNFVSNLESTYTNGQIGDECSVNDDVFGLLALIASGTVSDAEKRQDVLNFLISKQDPTDGGFGFSAPGCAWYMTSADMTAAALQALVEAKNHGLTHADLDSAIDKAKAYLLANQNSDGGFGYFGSSDPDTTGWVLQAFNVLGMQDSDQANAARNYLLLQKSETDGGFKAFDWNTNTFVSNATTTAQAVIALSGKGWVIKIYDPTAGSGQAPSSSTNTGSSNNSTNNSPTSTPTPNPTATPTPVIVVSNFYDDSGDVIEEEETDETPLRPSDSEGQAEEEVLGTKTTNNTAVIFAWIFTGLGVVFIFIYLAKAGIIKNIIKK